MERAGAGRAQWVLRRAATVITIRKERMDDGGSSAPPADRNPLWCPLWTQRTGAAPIRLGEAPGGLDIGEEGRGMTVAGIVLGWIPISLWDLYVVVVVFGIAMLGVGSTSCC